MISGLAIYLSADVLVAEQIPSPDRTHSTCWRRLPRLSSFTAFTSANSSLEPGSIPGCDRCCYTSTYTHFKPRSVQFEHEGWGPADAMGRSLRSHRTLFKFILSSYQTTDKKYKPPHATCAARRKLLAGRFWLA